MKRLAILLTAWLGLASVGSAANLSLLNCGDFSGTPALEHVSDIADGTLGGINLINDYDGGGYQTVVVSGIEYRVMGFWKTTNTLTHACIAVSKNRGHWHTTVYDGTNGLPAITCTDNTDPHYTVIFAVDPDLYLHLWPDMHASALKYYKSTHTITDAAFGPVGSASPMTGNNETSCSYFRPFIADGQLHVDYRAGTSTSGSIYRKTYDHGAGTWSGANGAGTDGLLINGISDSIAPYWQSARVLTNGLVALPWIWRMENTGTTDYSDCSNVFWNPSTGAFTKADGTSQTVPVTRANDDVFEAFTTSEVVGRPVFATDSDGRLHATYFYLTKLVHKVWESGVGWSSRNDVLTLTNPIFYDIVVRSDDLVAVVVYRDTADNKLKSISSGADDYTTWGSPVTLHNTAFTDSNFGPTHDEDQWQTNQEYFCRVPIATTVPFLRGKSGLLHYPLGEASGTRRAYGGNTLTDTNTVTSGTGKIGTCAQFTAANTEVLSSTDNAIFDFTGALTIDVWVKLDSKGADRGIVGKWTNTGNQRSYTLLFVSSLDRFQFGVSSDGSTGTVVNADVLGSPSTGVWYHIIAWHDPTADTINIRVNNGTANSAAHSTNIFNGTALFQIGRHRETFYWDGAIDEPKVFADVPTTAQQDFLYNSGNARQWSELAYVAPTIYSHGSTATVDVSAGDTPSIEIAAWGDLPMGEANTGTNGASYTPTDNADGTWTNARTSPISAGTETLTFTASNAAGSDAVDLTINAASAGGNSLPAILPLLLGDRRQPNQRKHFDTYGVYALAP